MPDPGSQSEANRKSASEPVFLVLGRILRPHGVRGELRVEVITDYPERIADLETVFTGSNPYDKTTATAQHIANVRRHRNYLLVVLEDVTTRDDAELYRGQLLMVALEDAVPLEEDEYYTFQILGANVVSTTGEELGQVSEILRTGANDVFVLRGGPRGEVLIPDVPHVVVEVDIENQAITVDLIPGLLPD